MRLITALTAGAMVMGCAVGIGATEGTALPAFALTDASGGTVSSRQLARAGTWLLVYVHADCPPCESVLQSVDKDINPTLPSRIVVVMATADIRGLRQTAERYPSLAGAAWYADTSAGAQALRLTSVPAVLGVRNAMIEWSVAGVLTDAADIKTIMASWVNR
jgi:hypothetical protein